MQITAITRFKHGKLYALLKKLGWTQSELATRSGMSQSQIGLILNLNRRPSADHANAIQRALGEAGEFFDVLSEWPESFQGLKKGYKREQTEEIEMERLLDCPEVMNLAIEERPDYSDLEECLGKLDIRQQEVIEQRVLEGKTLAQIAKRKKLTRARIQQIQAGALRKLRSPIHFARLFPDVD